MTCTARRMYFGNQTQENGWVIRKSKWGLKNHVNFEKFSQRRNRTMKQEKVVFSISILPKECMDSYPDPSIDRTDIKRWQKCFATFDAAILYEISFSTQMLALHRSLILTLRQIRTSFMEDSSQEPSRGMNLILFRCCRFYPVYSFSFQKKKRTNIFTHQLYDGSVRVLQTSEDGTKLYSGSSTAQLTVSDLDSILPIVSLMSREHHLANKRGEQALWPCFFDVQIWW